MDQPSVPSSYLDFFRPEEPFGVRVALTKMAPDKREELFDLAGVTARERCAIELFVFSSEVPEDAFKPNKAAAAPDPAFAAVIRKRLNLDARVKDASQVERQAATLLACSDERKPLPKDRHLINALRVSFVIGMERLINFMTKFAK